jgi:hypothetical protein
VPQFSLPVFTRRNAEVAIAAIVDAKPVMAVEWVHVLPGVAKLHLACSIQFNSTQFNSIIY